MPRIAISYRRDDSGVITGRIFDRLAAHYGRESVFRDIDNIPPGVDFRRHINAVLDESDIVLAIVGPKWVGPRAGQNRLTNAADPVRVEVETALRKEKPVIPVLVLRASMPRVEQLPETLEDLAYRHAVSVDAGQDFDQHMARLIRSVDRVLNEGAEQRPEAIMGPSAARPMPQFAADPPSRLQPSVAEIEALRAANRSLESALNAVTAAHRDIEQQLARLREDSAAAIGLAQRETERLTQELTSLKGSMAAVIEERDELRAKVTRLETEIADLLRRTLMQARAPM